MERCQRCGVMGEDRRTLWMACLYAMNEMGEIPFKQVAIYGTVRKQVGEQELSMIKTTVPVFESEPAKGAEDFMHKFFTLRVCKDCRADWMEKIREWFKTPKSLEGDGDVPIRELGAIKMITEEEFYRRQEEKEGNK